MKIDVLGWYNHFNIGDEAYKLAFPLLLPGHELRFVEEIDAESDAEVLILGGGDVLHPAFTRFLPVSRAREKIALSITLTAGSDLDTLAMFDRVYVRDNRSLDIGLSRSGNVSYLPDATFLLQPDAGAGRKRLECLFEEEGIPLRERVVVVVMSAYTAFNSNQALARDFVNFLKLAVDLNDILDRVDASIVFVPFSTKIPHDDRMSNAFVGSRSRAYDKNYIVYDRLGVQDTLDIVAAADAVVSTRLHSTIFSTIASVPFIDLTHHDKNLGFIETIGKPEWSIPLWEFSFGRFRQLISGFVRDKLLTDYLDLSRVVMDAREQLGTVDLLGAHAEV